MNTVGSILETFKIGAGPSSSHSIGPQRAARHFMASLLEPPARIRVTLYGSLAATGRGHWTDRTVAAALAPIPCEFAWEEHAAPLPHPNTLKFEALSAEGRTLREWTAYSIGGGDIADDHGKIGREDPVAYPVHSATGALQFCAEQGLAFWQLAERYETSLWPRLEQIWLVMKDSVQRGLHNKEATLPGSLGLQRRAPGIWAHAQNVQGLQSEIARISAFAMAVSEENASGGTVVTAPTCGSAGILPGLLYFFEEEKDVPRAVILRALATAGFFGTLIRTNATVSGAEAGCQAEVGSACSMASAAGSQILGGSLAQIEYAAEMAMEHHLGLTCDPVEGYVQIPCIERNMAGCLRAFECATFSLSTDGRHLVSFDDVIDVMFSTGKDLQSAYRETARGGLALLWQRRKGRDSRGEPPPAR